MSLYSENDIVNALGDIEKNGTSSRKAAFKFNVPKSTLYERHLKENRGFHGSVSTTCLS